MDLARFSEMRRSRCVRCGHSRDDHLDWERTCFWDGCDCARYESGVEPGKGKSR